MVTVEAVLLLAVLVALVGNLMVGFQIRDRLDGVIAALKPKS